MIPNLATVDEQLSIYRGGQPDADGWRHLAYDLCVKHVIKLNTESEGSDSMAMELGMDVTECPISLTQQILTEPDLQRLRAAVDFIQPNTFIHCGSVARTQHAVLIGEQKGAGGEDRTGLCVGYYRVLKNGWTKHTAYSEMSGHGFHPILLGLLKAWEDLKESAS